MPGHSGIARLDVCVRRFDWELVYGFWLWLSKAVDLGVVV